MSMPWPLPPVDLRCIRILGKQEAAASRLIIMFGADVNFEDRADKAGPLVAAVRAGCDDLVGDLLIAGADPNAHQYGWDGGTPLHAAAERGLASTISVLLSSPKTDKNALNNDGRSPLTMASCLGHVAALKTLLAAGADVHIRGASQYLALAFGRESAATAMVEHDGSLSVLHWTALMDHADCAAALVDAGADTNAKSGRKDVTPFLLAARAGSIGALLALLRRGASVSTKQLTMDLRLYTS
ncbi:unnamed protein product [Ectocarpus sp. 4 AP-2014]